MHFFKAHKRTVLLFGSFALVTLVAASLMIGLVGSVAHAASGKPLATTFHGAGGTVTRLSKGKPSNATLPKPTAGTPPAINYGKPSAFDIDHVAKKNTHAATTLSGKPKAASLSVNATEGQILHNFNSISDQDQAVANGGPQFAVTPPDQGLCVGFDPGDPGQVAVFQLVNSAVRETANNGGPLGGSPLLGNATFTFSQFFEPNSFSDPKCFYDSSTQTFFFTDIGFNLSGPDANQTSTDIAVFNAHGFAVYQLDTSNGAQFFGDQPHVGYDNNNLYIATDSFNVPGTAYFGASLYVLDKAALVSEASTVPLVTFGPLSLGGIPVLTLQPAVSITPENTEFLLNSFPFADADITPNAISNQLGFWQVDNGADLGKGEPQNVTLEGKIISSETYAFPVPAVSTGTGKVDNNGITSEAALNPDDSRLQQVEELNGNLWTALTTAVSIGSDPVARDGVAWFKINASMETVVEQGYIASQGNYLLYPAILKTSEGTVAMTFTITGPNLNPTAAYVVRRSGVSSFGTIHGAANGAGPHRSFSDFFFGVARWGDYSAAVLAPNGQDIWMATEYIPPAFAQNVFDNWGTDVFDVMGDH